MNSNFAPKLICFDCDLTLINENSWHDMNSAMGVTAEEDTLLVNWGEQGIITDQMGQQILAGIYRRRNEDAASSIRTQAALFTLADGAQEAVTKLQTAGYEVAIISGALDMVVQRVAEALHVETWYSGNVAVFENDSFSTIFTAQNNPQFKLSTLLKLCKERGITASDCVFVGDGTSDIPCFEATKHGICKRNDALESRAWQVVDSLTDVPALFAERAN